MPPPIARPPVIRLERLAELGDEVRVRDARAGSPHPALERGPSGDLIALGPFNVIQRTRVSRDEGRAFVEATGDENPIHIESDVLPGAMIAARSIALPELILAGARIERARMKFRAISRYGPPLVHLYRMAPGEERTMRIDLQVRQDGSLVAEGQLSAVLDGIPHQAAPAPGAVRTAAGTMEAGRVRAFLASLRLDPEPHLGTPGPVYPRAYLAALPSGEMVRRFRGEGGLLNVLELEFPATLPGLDGSSPPTVELAEPPRARRTFRKVLARIAEGVRTVCTGFAMVLPGLTSEAGLTSEVGPTSERDPAPEGDASGGLLAVSH